ncbi:DUF3558 domain-containing protein [Rhodococcus sp. D2-41]|uniref:DUF3558 family protein n=1 Tax=Speluncibacter jeojiensis TaxID=2710754 RepID=A0A9X4M277_9ACTN|nr:DUF3558 family protein [Rhodococcus sp. D2-41]MDG3011310.1 DUF3558 domain-containing protein [Rhodococcus sp. D2-41]MDG3016678.1 DUF3558 family protein [Corynebacteriales bacterium D3-21]
MNRNWLVATGAGVVAALSVAACGSAAPRAGHDAAGDRSVFDPCQLTQSQLSAIGDRLTLSKYNDISVQDEENRSCSWDGDWYTLTVESHGYSFEDAQGNSSYVDFTPVDLSGWNKAAKFTSPQSSFDEDCGIILGVQQGVVSVVVGNTSVGAAPQAPCDKATDIAKALSPDLPR